MSGKILQVFNFLDIRSNDFLKILLIAGWGEGGGQAGRGGNEFIKNMLLLFPKKRNLFWGKWAILGLTCRQNDVFF